MKKGRPAIILSALAPLDLEASLADLILRETTTLGVLVYEAAQAQAHVQWVQDDHGQIG